MGVFKSIEEFAKYVGKEFLTPPFYITKIITTGKKHPTNYAEVKYEAIIEGEGIIPSKEVEVRYQMIKDKLMSNSIDNSELDFDPNNSVGDIERLVGDWWDTNHLYYNGQDVITYINKKRLLKKYEFWVLNISSLGENPNRFTVGGISTDLWLNKYTTTLRNFIKESDEPFFYKIPIKKTPAFDFMNWKDSPLK